MSRIKCLIVDDEPTAREIIKTYLEKLPDFELVASCKNALEAMEQVNKTTIDLIFLDINMPEVSGMSFAKTLTKNTRIIFTTAYREYAIDGFDLQAVDYLLKPISMERFLQAIQKYRSDTSSSLTRPENENEYIIVRSDRKMLKVDFKNMLYIESLSDYIKIHTSKKTIVSRETISNLESRLPSVKFLRTHRSFIVNVDHIESFTNEYIEIGNKAIPISRSYRQEVLRKLG